MGKEGNNQQLIISFFFIAGQPYLFKIESQREHAGSEP